MSYTTYENTSNPHVTIHYDGCKQIMKHGGEHKYKNGRYKRHDSYEQAHAYAKNTGLPEIKDCSFCKPS